MRIDSWPADSRYPNGHFVRSIGPIGDIETETAVVLMEHQLTPEPFTKAVLAGTWMLHSLTLNSAGAYITTLTRLTSLGSTPYHIY